MINNRKNNRPMFLTWLLPGLEIKRWVFTMFLGTISVILGVAILLQIHPMARVMQFVKQTAEVLPSDITGSILLAIGGIIFLLAFRKANKSVIGAIRPDVSVLEQLYIKKVLNKGPRIVAIGGGTGLSTILKGLKHITGNLTAVVTVGDDGGSSGRLREEMGILPPGDIRNCIAGLANEEDLVTKLFQYRFKTGNGLEGHSFGNLFLTAMCAITGDMVSAVKESSKVLSIRGRVLPSTLDDMKLIAEMEDGRVIYGESNIPEAGGRISRLKATPENLQPLCDVITAINEAEIIILGPGSLYTSVIPNLLIDEIVQAIDSSKARKIYICNIMTQPGETDDYSVSDHIKAILSHSQNKKIIDTVLINDILPKNLAQKYQAAGSLPVVLDADNIKKLDIKLITRTLIEENSEGLVRHSPEKIARAVLEWFKSSSKHKKHNNIDFIQEALDDSDHILMV